MSSFSSMQEIVGRRIVKVEINDDSTYLLFTDSAGNRVGYQAEGVDFPRVITVRGGVLNLRAGDWLVFDGATYRAVEDNEFQRLFEAL